MSEKFDCIVVGAGPAGVAAGYTLAKGGANVIILERGEYPGAKNVMGGVLYAQMLRDIIPDFEDRKPPLERHIIEQRYWLLTEDSATTFSYKSNKFDEKPHNNYTVLRAKFDKWFAQQAVDVGALLITETVARDLIIRNGRVVGVSTDRPDGDLYADVVIIADGVNSLLAKKAGFHDEIRPEEVAIAVKEVMSLPKEVIEERFNVRGDQGITIELIGDATGGMVGTGFIYTNKDSLSVGTGVLLSDLVRTDLNPNDLLERMKNHPMVKPLLQGATTKEYLAHLIPEGGYNSLPPLYGDGFMIAGDAAMLVVGVHREGSNHAMASGRMAGEMALEALKKGDTSAENLSAYRQRLNDSFVLKDLRKYKGVTEFFEKHPHFFTTYPQILNQAAHEFMLVDGVSKSDKQKKIISMARKARPLTRIAGDLVRAWRAFI